MSTHNSPRATLDLETAFANFSLDDIPVEDEPDSSLVDIPPKPETLASQLMGQVVYQINRRIRELDAREPQGMNRTELSKRMGVSKSQVSRLLGAQQNTTLLTVAKAAFALGLTKAVLKLVPEEDAPHQLDEVKAFVENEQLDCSWWPLTDRRAASKPITACPAPPTSPPDCPQELANSEVLTEGPSRETTPSEHDAEVARTAREFADQLLHSLTGVMRRADQAKVEVTKTSALPRVERENLDAPPADNYLEGSAANDYSYSLVG